MRKSDERISIGVMNTYGGVWTQFVLSEIPSSSQTPLRNACTPLLMLCAGGTLGQID